MPDIDLKQLAIDRSDSQVPVPLRRHLLTRYVLPGCLLCALLVLLGWHAYDVVFPPLAVMVTPVMAAEAEMRTEGTPLFQAAGWIEPRPTLVRVAALAPGVVEQLLVVEDQAIRAGEPVAELIKADAELAYQRSLADHKLCEAELKEAQATLEAALTRLQQPVHLQAQLSQAEAALAEAETALAQLPFELKRAEAELAFSQKSYDGKQGAGAAISGRTLDAAKRQVDAATALVEELRLRSNSLERQRTALVGRRDALQSQLELRTDEIQARDEALAQKQAAEARLEQADVQVKEAKLRLERMTIRAPIDGRVFQLLGHPGTRLGGEMANQQTHDGSTVITMYSPESLQVRVDVRFQDIPQIHLGQEARIKNPALPQSIRGTVLFTSSEADVQKNTLEVKVAIASPPSVLKPDMLVDVTFLAAASDAAHATDQPRKLRVFLPQRLVQQADQQSYVWLADQSQQRALRTVIQTGPPGLNGMVEVTQGLTVTSQVISNPIESLRDGQRIRITRENATPTLPGSQSNESGSSDNPQRP